MAKGHIGLFWLGSLVPFYEMGLQTTGVQPLSFICLTVRKEKMALYNHQPAIWPQKKKKKKKVGNCFFVQNVKREQERERVRGRGRRF